MVQANNGWIVFMLSVVLVVSILAPVLMTRQIVANIPEVNVPTADEIANAAIAKLDIPSSEAIAALIPEGQDTYLGVRDAKKDIAESLALAEMEDEDFLDDLADFLTDECDDIDIEAEDITNIIVKETEFSGFMTSMPTWDNSGTVELELKVYFDNDGDDDEAERVKVQADFEVVDLIYDDNYEDAEVDEYNFDLLKVYGDNLSC